ncbi:MAG: type I restriction enzyme S subunit [Glaciecola sp.]|jgi:type I restriction enzyme S subunit
MSTQQLVTAHIDLWTSSIKARNTQGRGSSKKRELYGIKKLRELILELAVRGKLVPQDSSDEPASVLLERLAAEKAQLIKDEKIKRQKPFPVITEDEKPFDLPLGWSWCKLGDLTEMYNGRAFKASEWSESGIPIVRIQNLNNKDAGFNYFSGEISKVNRIDNGSFLISWSGTPGTSFGAFIWSRGEAALNQHINNCIFNYSGMNLEFMRLAVNGCMNHFISMAQGAVGLKHVTKGTLNNAVIGFPGEKEQQRIVAKVDELMAFCDQLEQQTESSLDAHNLLVDTLLATLTDARDANELSDNWTRLADHFDTLITTDYAVEQLKQTILQLAVQGKLVPQDPNDEPASELLKRIAAEKEQLIKDKKIKKQKLLSGITYEEKPFELPVGWQWVKCLNICYKITDGEHATPKRSEFGHYLLSARNVTNKGIKLDDVDFVPQGEFDRIRKRCDPNIGDILISCSGSVGRIALVDADNSYSMVRSAAMIRPDSKELNIKFLALMLRSPYLQIQMKARSKQSAQANLFLGAISNLVFVIPPLLEQQKITDKVDQLMVLCDQLKFQLNNAKIIQLHLADTVVDSALSGTVLA